MKVYFNYGDTNNKKKPEQKIIARLSYGTNKLDKKISTRIAISREGWNFKKGEEAGVVNLMTGSRSVSEAEYYQKVQNKLDHIRSYLKNEFRKLKLKPEFNLYTKQEWNKWAREHFEIAIGLKQAKTTISPLFIDKFQEYIDQNKLTWSHGTLRGYLSHKNLFEEFMTFKDHKYKTDEIDLKFYKELQEWSYEEKEHLPNTFGNHIKKVKAVMNYFIAEEKGFQHHPNIKSRRFQKISKSVPHEILSPDELDLIFNYNGKDYLENARDITKFLYWGCLRYGEFKKALKQKNLIIQKTKHGFKWTVYITKNEELKAIPIHNDVMELINNNWIPRNIDRGNYVTYLKEILKECEIHKEKIGAHTIRRSFCTNMYNDEHTPANIMMYSGHKTEKMLMEYIQQKNVVLKSTIPTE